MFEGCNADKRGEDSLYITEANIVNELGVTLFACTVRGGIDMI
jgi:hypothetical protein